MPAEERGRQTLCGMKSRSPLQHVDSRSGALLGSLVTGGRGCRRDALREPRDVSAHGNRVDEPEALDRPCVRVSVRGDPNRLCVQKSLGLDDFGQSGVQTAISGSGPARSGSGAQFPQTPLLRRYRKATLVEAGLLFVRGSYLTRPRRSSSKLALRTASSRLDAKGFPVSSNPSQIRPVFGSTV